MGWERLPTSRYALRIEEVEKKKIKMIALGHQVVSRVELIGPLTSTSECYAFGADGDQPMLRKR